MNFYNNTHPYYCGIDLHARSLYVCIIDQTGNTCLHKDISAHPDKLQQLLEPYIGNIVVGVEYAAGTGLPTSVMKLASISSWVTPCT